MKMYRPLNLAKHAMAGLVLAASAFSVQADSGLWSLVWASHDQAKVLNYSGLLITESGKHSQTSKLQHQSTSGGEFEVLERLDGQPAKWIRHNDQIQCVIPDRKMILTERRHTSIAFPRVLAGEDGGNGLEKLYNISEMPGQRVAGRAVRVLKLTPKDDMRYEYRLYIDRENNLLMRSELHSPKGEVLENIGFKEITFEPTVIENPALVKAGPGWRTSSTEVRKMSPEELTYDLPDLAFGFKKADTVCRVKSKDELIHQTVYSDGLSTLSVFIQKHNAGQSMPQVPMSHGAVMSKSETQGQHLVTVLGEVPEKTLGLFLKSVRWKSQ
ncbi:MucB/RseB C-terminal domain-containing protein [Limnobacter parvus]|uniref:MucB/RseB C-terminal domain-containing protein n=1 Tax=Limnobacter parvus TaxID=2939690 RepID=A0ABT1XK33_9BURK|nr:MucB/RseB C-terminal domain-containing protein [Limnobacter parvus]MCR2746913.1 MucB/RseB C-terminal domain-containing protein [Limnobacter parvus]